MVVKANLILWFGGPRVIPISRGRRHLFHAGIAGLGGLLLLGSMLLGVALHACPQRLEGLVLGRCHLRLGSRGGSWRWHPGQRDRRRSRRRRFRIVRGGPVEFADTVLGLGRRTVTPASRR